MFVIALIMSYIFSSFLPTNASEHGYAVCFSVQLCVCMYVRIPIQVCTRDLINVKFVVCNNGLVLENKQPLCLVTLVDQCSPAYSDSHNDWQFLAIGQMPGAL